MEVATLEAFNRLSNPWKAYCYNSVSQTFVANTGAFVKYDSQGFDPMGMFSGAGTSSAGLTPQKSGYYLITANQLMGSAASGTYNINMGVCVAPAGNPANVTQFIYGASYAGNFIGPCVTGSIILPVNAGQLVQIEVTFNNATATNNTTLSGDGVANFSMVFLSPI